MGRESRQARRARERRLQEQRQRGHGSGTFGAHKWSIGVGAAIVAIVVVFFGAMAATGNNSGANDISAKATADAAAQAKTEYTPVPGLAAGPARCSYSEMVAPGFYHVHAALTLFHNGKSVVVPPQIGFAYSHDCLYWVHTHNPSYGIIHIESPSKIIPTLGNFFQIWGVPLSTRRVWNWNVAPGQLEVFVDQKPYLGNPAQISLHPHTDITIEVGKPFVPPPKFDFKKYQV